MTNVTVRQFAQFMLTPSPARPALVRNELRRTPYQFKADFWGPFRATVARAHEPDGDLKTISGLGERWQRSRKGASYADRAHHYLSFLKSTGAERFVPRPTYIERDDLRIVVKAEVGFRVRGREHPAKLWPYNDPPSDRLAETIARLMAVSGRGEWPQGSVPGLLDIRGETLLLPERDDPLFDAMVEADMAAFQILWSAIHEREAAAEAAAAA